MILSRLDLPAPLAPDDADLGARVERQRDVLEHRPVGRVEAGELVAGVDELVRHAARRGYRGRVTAGLSRLSVDTTGSTAVASTPAAVAATRVATITASPRRTGPARRATARSNPNAIDTTVVTDAPSTEKNPLTAQHHATSRPWSAPGRDRRPRRPRPCRSAGTRRAAGRSGTAARTRRAMRAHCGHDRAASVSAVGDQQVGSARARSARPSPRAARRGSRRTTPDSRAPTAVAMSSVNSDTDSDRVGKPSSSAKRWIIEISMSMKPSPSDGEVDEEAPPAGHPRRAVALAGDGERQPQQDGGDDARRARSAPAAAARRWRSRSRRSRAPSPSSTSRNGGEVPEERPTVVDRRDVVRVVVDEPVDARRRARSMTSAVTPGSRTRAGQVERPARRARWRATSAGDRRRALVDRRPEEHDRAGPADRRGRCARRRARCGRRTSSSRSSERVAGGHEVPGGARRAGVEVEVAELGDHDAVGGEVVERRRRSSACV